jgi:hypothetical protein
MSTTRVNLNSQTLTDAIKSIGNLVDQTTQISIDLLESYSRLLQSSLRGAPSQVSKAGQTAMDALQNLGSMRMITGGCCKIPPPCWLPQPAGDITSHVCPGATATVQLCVTNCSFAARTITIETPANAGIAVSPSSFTLGPLERKCANLSLAAAAGSQQGLEIENLILVKGCRLHYIRWTVAVSARGGCTCHEVEVEDCQDYIHHWYDHFYCPRPCLPQDTKGRA